MTQVLFPNARRAALLVTLAWSAGCGGKTDPVTAPTELEDLAPYLFQHQDDAALLSLGLTSLSKWADARATVDDGYILPSLPEDAIEDITPPPGTSLSDTMGGLADAPSTATLQQHIDFILLPDQTVVDPDDYSTFDRTFIEGGDCFGDGSCDRLVTGNDMVKTAAFNVTIPYFYFKDYQRTTYTDVDGVERPAVVSRGWIEKEGWGDDHKNGVRQSYTLDVFQEAADGKVHRTQALWTEMVLIIDDVASQSFLEDQLILGLHDVFDDTDNAIVEQGL